MEYVKNKFSITIKKCCASCKFKKVGDDTYRTCGKDGSKRKPYDLCFNGWEMSPGLDNAGKGGGHVKRKAYIDYTVLNGFGMADEFERKFGSRYLTK
jgi:hypothetical protein